MKPLNFYSSSASVFMSSAAAGQTSAQTAQPIQSAGRGIQGMDPAIDKQSVGHRAQQRPQPVQAVSFKTGTSRHVQSGCARLYRVRRAI
jgi:hypothetical protein